MVWARLKIVAAICAGTALSWTVVYQPLPSAAAQDNAGLKVVVTDPLRAIRTEQDVAGSTYAQFVRLVGPRNGYCSASVIAFSAQGLNDLRVELSPLEMAGGQTIPADAVQIRYATKKIITDKTASLTTNAFWVGDKDARIPYYDILNDNPPANATLVPIWITVRIPTEARAGDYSGTLTVNDEQVPVRLTACAWKCPDPKDFAMYVGLLHSAETLAQQYNTDLWSPKHFQLLERTLKFLSDAGNKELWITAINETFLGNDTGMIRFRKAEGGQLAPDFSVMEKYLDIYKKVGGNPRAIVVYVWKPTFLGDRRTGPIKHIAVTAVDASGKTSRAMVPMYGEPGSGEIWKPVLDGVRQRIKEHGWSEDTLMIGLGFDQRPRRETVAFFSNIAGYARWSLWTHGRGDPSPKDGKLIVDGMVVGLYTWPFLFGPKQLPKSGVAGSWNSGYQFYISTSLRYLLDEFSAPSQFRKIPWASQCVGAPFGKYPAFQSTPRGFGGLGIDFWEVNGKPPILCTKARAVMRPVTGGIIAPGPDGPIGTCRYEMLREGIQQAEATITIEKAIVARGTPEALVEKCSAFLQTWFRVHQTKTEDYVRRWGQPPHWQDLTATLFTLAGQVPQGQMQVAQQIDAQLEAPLVRQWRAVLEQLTAEGQIEGYRALRRDEASGMLQLDLSGTDIADLTPLRGMPLAAIDVNATRVSNIDVLKDMPLTTLNLAGTKVRDISGLKGMRLTRLNLWNTQVTDISVLKGMPLTSLDLGGTGVTDISGLKGMPLREVYLYGCKDLHDLSPLADCKELVMLGIPEHSDDIEFLRHLPKISSINRRTAPSFWQTYDKNKNAEAGRPAQTP